MDKPNSECESIKRNTDMVNNPSYFFCLDLGLIQKKCLGLYAILWHSSDIA